MWASVLFGFDHIYPLHFQLRRCSMTYRKFFCLCEKQVLCDNGVLLLLLTNTSGPLLANQSNGESLRGVGVIAARKKQRRKFWINISRETINRSADRRLFPEVEQSGFEEVENRFIIILVAQC